jgi:hypothetical protein
LSVAVGVVYVTTAEHCPAAVGRTMFAGQLMVGAVVSFTVTVNVQVAVLFAASVAVHVTVVVPFWNVDPDAGVQTTVGVPPQVSVAVGVA